MNIPAISAAIEAVKIPGTERTLGSEKAVQLLEERSDGLHIGLKFGFPVGHIAADIGYLGARFVPQNTFTAGAYTADIGLEIQDSQKAMPSGYTVI